VRPGGPDVRRYHRDPAQHPPPRPARPAQKVGAAMRYGFSDDQLAFRVAVRDLLAKVAGPDTPRAVWAGDRGWDPAVWSHLAGMGVLGLLAPESAGGLALDETDLVLILA